MKASQWVRQIHRWGSITFTFVAIANIVALIVHANAPWLGFLALPPLIVAMFTGVYLFALPYWARGRAGGTSDAA